MGIQRKLRRRNIQITDSVQHKFIGGNEAAGKTRRFFLFNIYDGLFQQDQADLPSRYCIVPDHIFIYFFIKSGIIINIFKNIFQKMVVNFFRIGILAVQFQLGNVNPVFGDNIIQIFVQADYFVVGPRNISGIRGIHIVFHNDCIAVQHGRNKTFIYLIIYRKLIIRSFFRGQFFPQTGQHFLFSFQKSGIYGLFVFSGVWFHKVGGVYYIIIKQGEINIVNRDKNIP